jgi:hypothetical protein
MRSDIREKLAAIDLLPPLELALRASDISDGSIPDVEAAHIEALLDAGRKLGRWVIVDSPVGTAMRASKGTYWWVELIADHHRAHDGQRATARDESLPVALARALVKRHELHEAARATEAQASATAPTSGVGSSG